MTWTEHPSGAVMAIADVDKDRQPDGSWKIHIHFRPDLAPGTYTGGIELNLVVLDLFTKILPVTVNYNLTVSSPQGNLTALNRIAGVNDWNGFGGNAMHSGFLPLTLDASKFSRRWTRASTVGTAFQALATSGNSVVVTLQDNGSGPITNYHPQLQSMAEADASVVWGATGSPMGVFQNLATAGNLVLTTSYEDSSGYVLHTYDQATGAQAYTHATKPSALELSSANHFAPVSAGGMICAGESAHNDLQCYDASSGNVLWSVATRATLDPHYADWAPAMNDTSVFANVGGTFMALNRVDGSMQFSLSVPGNNGGSALTVHELNQVPVVVDSNSVVMLDHRNADVSPTANTLTMVDLPGKKIRWQAQGQFTAHPIAAAGLIFVGNQTGQQMEARDVQSGNIVWTWPLSAQGETYFGGNMLVTNNLLFIATGNGTYAVDLSSHQTVWSYPLSGKLAMSAQGVLYILAQGGPTATSNYVVAINTR